MVDNAANGLIRKNDDGYEVVFLRRLKQPIEKVYNGAHCAGASPTGWPTGDFIEPRLAGSAPELEHLLPRR